MLELLATLGLLSRLLLPALPPASSPTTLHQPPAEVKAVYVTSNMVRHPQFQYLRQLLRDTELNAVVINTKEPWGPRLDDGLRRTVAELKAEGVWTIARHVTFQDDDLAERRPELALKRPDGKLWRDNGGRTWVDPTNRQVWQHNADIARRTMALGFDEINLDYVRFPSDGDTKTISYPSWNKVISKEDSIAGFIAWFRREIKATKPDVILSADVFAYALVEDWDLDIGQRVSKLAPVLDVIAPMAYPSHYYGKNFGYANPAEHPYEVVRQTLELGRPLMVNAPKIIIRPWLQDFDMGAEYTAPMVLAEMKAVKDAGYNDGWMLWNPRNVYTRGALADDKQ